MFCFSFSWANILHENCLLTRLNFSIKILLAEITFLFWILLCYLLNILMLCISSISWCCLVFYYSAALLMFHYSMVFWLFHQCFGAPPVFQCSTSVTCSNILCSGVPGFIICCKKWVQTFSDLKTAKTLYIQDVWIKL